MMFKLEEMPDLGFEIEVKRPPKYDKWECSIIFNGKNKQFDLNADLCLFLEDWKEHRKKRIYKIHLNNIQDGKIELYLIQLLPTT